VALATHGRVARDRLPYLAPIAEQAFR